MMTSLLHPARIAAAIAHHSCSTSCVPPSLTAMLRTAQTRNSFRKLKVSALPGFLRFFPTVIYHHMLEYTLESGSAPTAAASSGYLSYQRRFSQYDAITALRSSRIKNLKAGHATSTTCMFPCPRLSTGCFCSKIILLTRSFSSSHRITRDGH